MATPSPTATLLPTLTSDAGETVRLSDLKGQSTVLYFNPKDDTPGC